MTCIECKYYLPSDDTFYNKPKGYCAHPQTGRPVKGLSASCARFEKMEGSVSRAGDRRRSAL